MFIRSLVWDFGVGRMCLLEGLEVEFGGSWVEEEWRCRVLVESESSWMDLLFFRLALRKPEGKLGGMGRKGRFTGIIKSKGGGSGH